MSTIPKAWQLALKMPSLRNHDPGCLYTKKNSFVWDNSGRLILCLGNSKWDKHSISIWEIYIIYNIIYNYIRGWSMMAHPHGSADTFISGSDSDLARVATSGSLPRLDSAVEMYGPSHMYNSIILYIYVCVTRISIIYIYTTYSKKNTCAIFCKYT